MITLAAPAPAFEALRTGLRHERLESVAILLCVPIKLSASDWRLVVRETQIAPPEAYEERTKVSARLAPSFGLPFERKARKNGWSIVYCHTHPCQRGVPRFSPIDDSSEGPLAEYANDRSPGVPHIALLFGADAVNARRLGTREPVRVMEIGSSIVTLFDPRGAPDSTDTFDRQVRAFGADGQRRLQLLRVGIVGLGGTGSLVTQQLAHLGVDDFILIDRDYIDVTNLNRTVGSTPTDVGAAKVNVAERMIRGLRSHARVDCIHADVVDQGVARRLAGADVVFCCTDSHASRHLLNQLAHQYLVPVIDLGVAIHVTSGHETQFAGHVKALAPGLACLWCLGNLDPRLVREETMNEAHRNADPYFGNSGGVVQPAVISLNGTVASLAVTMLLSMVAGVPSSPRYIIYDGNRARVNAVAAVVDPACNFCSPESTALAGDASPLPERRHGPR